MLDPLRRGGKEGVRERKRCGKKGLSACKRCHTDLPFSFFLCQGFVIGSVGLSLTLCTKNKSKLHNHYRFIVQDFVSFISNYEPPSITISLVHNSIANIVKFLNHQEQHSDFVT